jgi:hypothetical protein
LRDSFTPEEVDRIENTAYEVGVKIGVTQERERIIAILERDADEWYRLGNRHTGNAIKLAIWLIKGENE